jgi:hypothetical protein
MTDPDHVPELVVKRRRWMFAVSLAACGHAEVMGILFLISPNIPLWARVAGAVIVPVFIFLLGLIGLELLVARPLRLTREGLWVGRSTFAPKFVRWSDVQRIAPSAAIPDQIAITLVSPQSFIAQFTEPEARATLIWMHIGAGVDRAIRFAVRAIRAPFGRWIRGGRAGDAPGSRSITVSLEALFARIRQMHGGEIAIAALQRDRNAVAFRELLETWRARSA